MSLQGTLVFASGRTADLDIWTLALETGELKRLTSGDGLNYDPRWSPDGSRIAYIAYGDDLISSLYVMNRDGSEVRQLTKNVHAQHPSWSPDGAQILFTSNFDNSDEIEVCSFDLRNDTYEVLFRRPGEETEPNYSPDGNRVIFSSIEPRKDVPFSHRNSEIWERNLLTGKERQIASHPARDYSPIYAPDGSQIAFVSHRNGRTEEEVIQELHKIHASLKVKDIESIDRAIARLQLLESDSEICVCDPDGSNVRELTKNNGAEVAVRWSPCSKYLVYSASPMMQENRQRIKIVEVESGKEVDFTYDREPLMREIDASLNNYIDDRLVWKLIPNFLEKPLKARIIGSYFFGEEHGPDWTYR